MVEQPAYRRALTEAKDIQIGWVNVGKGSPSHIAALEIAYDEGIDVLCVQEPFTYVGTRTSTHPGYAHHPPVEAWDDPAEWEAQRPRVMTYIRKGAGLRITHLQPMQNRDLHWVEVNGISILNVYRQPQTPQALDYVIHLSPPSRCIVGGDFNAKHDLFEPGAITSQGGAELAKWAAESGMDYIGEPGKATHRAGHVIDLTFSNVPFTKTVVRPDLHCGSDHDTQVTTIPGRGRQPLEQYHYRVPTDKLPKFVGIVALGIHRVHNPDGLASDELETCIDTLTQVIDEGIHMAGKADRGAGHSAPWWTAECREARQHHLRSMKRHTGRGPTEATRAFHTTVRKAKREYWRHTIDNIDNDQDLYRVIGWHQLEPTRPEKPLIIDDRPIFDEKEKAEALHKAILCRFNADDDLENPPPPPPQDEPALLWDDSLTMEEVERNTIGVTSTSPGPDRVTVRLLKACWHVIQERVCGIFRRCLQLNYFPRAWKLAEVAMIPKAGKKDRSTPRAYRPIALLSCLGKGFERIIARRLAWTAMTEGILSPQHTGALPKRSAMDLVTAFKHDVERAFARGKCVTMVTMDVQGAFDALLVNRLLHRMKAQGWATEVLQLTRSFLTDRRVRVRLGKSITPNYTVQCGTPQGSPLSPVLYTLYLAELIKAGGRHRFGYADDICLYRAADTPEESNSLIAKDVSDVIQWGADNRVAFAPEKLEMIHLTRQRGPTAPPCTVSDTLTIHPTTQAQEQDSPKQPALRWLGVWFDRKLTFKRHIAERAAKARKVALHIRGLARTTCGPPAASLRKAVITCVIPRLLFGAEAWYGGRTKPPLIRRQARAPEVSARLGEHVAIVHKTLALAARGVLPAYRTTPTATLFRDAGLPSGHVALEEAKIRFAVHLQTIDMSHPLTERAQPPQIQRGRGAGSSQQPRTIVERVGTLLDPVPRPTLTKPHYSPGCRTDPTEGIKKRAAAQAFEEWWLRLPQEEVTVFSDGSEQWIDGTKQVTYGYVIYQGRKEVSHGRGSLHTRSHVFDAEAVGAWRGLEHVMREPALRLQRIWMCIDSTSVIWCLRGNAPSSSQWAFLRCQQVMEAADVRVRWSPGHMGILGNERADRLADMEAHSPHPPALQAAEPTVTGLRSDAQAKRRLAEIEWWSQNKSRLSTWYNQWDLPYSTTAPAELSLSRRALAKLLSTRTMHGDYAWYHKKFKHEDADLNCACGKEKSPSHIVHCPRARRRFASWPHRPAWPPTNSQEGLHYLKELLSSPEDFVSFIGLINPKGSGL